MHQKKYNENGRQTIDKEKMKGQFQRRSNKKGEADKIVSQVLAACQGNSFSNSDNSEQVDNASMMVMEDKVSVFDSSIALMADSDSEGDNTVTLLDIKDNLKN